MLALLRTLIRTVLAYPRERKSELFALHYAGHIAALECRSALRALFVRGVSRLVR